MICWWTWPWIALSFTNLASLERIIRNFSTKLKLSVIFFSLLSLCIIFDKVWVGTSNKDPELLVSRFLRFACWGLFVWHFRKTRLERNLYVQERVQLNSDGWLYHAVIFLWLFLDIWNILFSINFIFQNGFLHFKSYAQNQVDDEWNFSSWRHLRWGQICMMMLFRIKPIFYDLNNSLLRNVLGSL